MLKNNKKRDPITMFDCVNVVIMLVIMLVTLYPFLYVLFVSLSDPMLFMENGGAPLVRPLGFTFESYRAVFQNNMIVRGMSNSFIILVLYIIISMSLTSVGAYFLSRKDVLLKKPIFIMIVITMYFNGGLIPTFLAVKGYGLYNSIWAVILTGAISTYNLIVLKTGFESLPGELEESAKIDGAGHLTILFRIVLPLSMACIAVMILYYAVAQWNSWFNANIYLTTRTKYPLQLILREILISNDTASMRSGGDVSDQMAIGETIKYAVIVVATVPILCVYPFLQKYFVKGVMVGAVKG